VPDLAPLYVVAGAPGAGKSTTLPHLIQQANGIVVMDMDELLEDGQLLGVLIADSSAAAIWPAYDRMWERIIAMVRRAGHSVLLLCPIPNEEAVSEGRGLAGRVFWLHLDCTDEARRTRLRNRSWSTHKIADAQEDAAHARTFLPDSVDSSSRPPTDVAQEIISWARRTSVATPLA